MSPGLHDGPCGGCWARGPAHGAQTTPRSAGPLCSVTRRQPQMCRQFLLPDSERTPATKPAGLPGHEPVGTLWLNLWGSRSGPNCVPPSPPVEVLTPHLRSGPIWRQGRCRRFRSQGIRSQGGPWSKMTDGFIKRWGDSGPDTCRSTRVSVKTRSKPRRGRGPTLLCLRRSQPCPHGSL